MPTPPLLLAAAAGLLVVSTPPPKGEPEGPPGMVLVEGGRVKVGVSMDDIKDVIVEKPHLGPALVSETPRHEVSVDDFFLMVTEVTNEQFAAFVAATDGRPPYTWGTAAIEEGLKAWFEEDNRKRLEAKEQGHRYTSTEKFEPERWWEQNWKDSEWHVPEEIADHPVTYVAFEDALDYARWAGLRLMSEAEYQCAGRGTSEQDYPWGKDWDPKKSAGLHAGQDKPWPVGSFPDGARNGIFDLIGNVWEWTSSPYTAYPGYKAHEFTTRGKERESFTPYAPFDANKRVMVGGSVHMDPIAMRLTVRRGTGRSERTNAAGFRCAASTKPGRDLAEYVTTMAIPGTAQPPGVEYALEQPTLTQRWTAGGPGVAEQGTALPGQDGEVSAGAQERPPGYAVITRYDAMLFVPVTQIEGTRKDDLEKASLAGPVHVGILYLTQPLLEPALEPGAYMLAYRGAGELPALEEGAVHPAWFSTPGLDPMVASYVFYDATGAPLLAWPAAPINYESMTTAGSVKLEPFVPPKKVEKDAPPPVPIDTLRFYVGVSGRQRGRGFKFDLPFKIEPGTVDATWK